MQAQIDWQTEMAFKCRNRDIETYMDATIEAGGKNSGPTPKELVLNAMMGCTAMDVVSILKKMRQVIQGFKMTIDAQKTIEHPVHFKSAFLTFSLLGEIDKEKLIKAVDMSLTKYCGVNYMISLSCHITFQVFLNQEMIHKGTVNFKLS